MTNPNPFNICSSQRVAGFKIGVVDYVEVYSPVLLYYCYIRSTYISCQKVYVRLDYMRFPKNNQAVFFQKFHRKLLIMKDLIPFFAAEDKEWILSKTAVVNVLSSIPFVFEPDSR
jgi:hypothetical protein